MKHLRPQDADGVLKKIFENCVLNAGLCFIFSGSKSDKGYGKIRFKNRCLRTHRLVFEIVNGPISDGFYVCHSCDNPSCCNPNHLFLGTDRENKDDMIRKNRQNNQYTKVPR